MSQAQSATNTTNDADDDPTRRIVTELENERFELVLAQNYDAFAGLCHPELQYTHSNGVREDRERYIAECKASTYIYHKVEHPIEEIAVHGDVALVHGRMRADLTVHGNRKTIDTLSTAVWVNTTAGWKLISYQATPAPAQ